MKVIDLLNKIANHEKVPKRIKYDNLIYVWDKVGYLHYRDNVARECAFLEGVRTDMVLNDEVELIEDGKDIQSIEKIDLFDNGGAYKDIRLIISSFDLNFTEISKTVNKLISSVKQLDKKIKEDKQ